LAGETRIVVKIPTGGGKTRLASEFIRRKKYIESGARVGFLMPRFDLVEQTIRAFREAGIPHVGVIQGLHRLTDPGGAGSDLIRTNPGKAHHPPVLSYFHRRVSSFGQENPRLD
jgi:superfamily II DNA or RNA helicase